MSSYNILPAADEALEKLQARIKELETEENDLTQLLVAMDKKFSLKRTPIEDERNTAKEELEKLKEELARKTETPIYPPAPGPEWYKFVDSGWFSAVCNLVVVLNLLCMGFAGQLQAYHSILAALDQVFLTWYVLELFAKWRYHRGDLFYGRLTIVWWNWLDASIVLSGVVDQWLTAPIKEFLPVKLPGLSYLRCLRLFRVLRFLRILKYLVHGDLSWTEKAPFQFFMSGVIALNSVVMGLELDYDLDEVWFWFEQAFLVVYFFEIFVRLKEFRCKFFINSDRLWNNLDFLMVSAGVFNLWVMPLYGLIQVALYGKADEMSGSATTIFKVLRMLKILRVLRLVRLLRMVKPLYNLLVGVMEALDAMKWVMVLTLLVLYAGAIVFTSLIGHGYIYQHLEEVPPEAEMYFGSVGKSIFSLFKLMNGDTSVVEPITQDIKGRLLFAVFMILSNWAVLAILTSVVSDNMIASSQRLLEEEKQKQEDDKFTSRTRQLGRFFQDLDSNRDGEITESEWCNLLSHNDRFTELHELTRLDRVTLRESFKILCEESSFSPESKQKGEERSLRCDDFIQYLNHDRDSIDKRQVMHHRYMLEKYIEARMQAQVNDIEKAIRSWSPGGRLADNTIEKGASPWSARAREKEFQPLYPETVNNFKLSQDGASAQKPFPLVSPGLLAANQQMLRPGIQSDKAQDSDSARWNI